MTRLIDADKLKKCAIPCEIHNGALTDLCVPLYQIDNAPTVDISKEIWDKSNELLNNRLSYLGRPRGQWIKIGQSFINPNKFRNFCCSNCLWDLDEHIRIKPNFCPNCGADMKGGAEE